MWQMSPWDAQECVRMHPKVMLPVYVWLGLPPPNGAAETECDFRKQTRGAEQGYALCKTCSLCAINLSLKDSYSVQRAAFSHLRDWIQKKKKNIYVYKHSSKN